MSHFRRAYVPGGSFFFTVVTERRAPILCTDTSRVFLRTAIFIVPTLRRGNSSGNAPALRDAGASLTAFPRWSVGTMNKT